MMGGQQPAHRPTEPTDQVGGLLVPMRLGQGGEALAVREQERLHRRLRPLCHCSANMVVLPEAGVSGREGPMDVPADRSRPTSALPVHPSLREAARSPRRRRPTGAAPPLPYRLQTSGVGWLVAALVLVGLTLV